MADVTVKEIAYAAEGLRLDSRADQIKLNFATAHLRCDVSSEFKALLHML